MDYKTYIGEIEKQLDAMTGSQMRAWIIQQGRTVEEEERESFLHNLRGDKRYKLLLSEQEINDWCEQVEEEILYFDTEQEEYYEEGDWEADYKVIYCDNCGMMSFLKKAAETCRRLMMLGEYKTTYRLLDRICRLKFECDMEGAGWEEIGEPLSLENLEKEGLLPIDLDKLALNLLYCCYQSVGGRERIENLYDYMMWDMCRNVKMTDVFAFGPEELKDTDVFMKKWLNFLEELPGDKTMELLTDACLYLGGESCLQRTARKMVKTHPGLYKLACQMRIEAEDWEKAAALGMEAVQAIDVDKVIRSDIADISCKAAEELKDCEMIKIFYEASFLSNPNSYHLLRLFRLKSDEILKSARARLESVPTKGGYGGVYHTEQSETMISEKRLKAVYRFILGDFTYCPVPVEGKLYIDRFPKGEKPGMAVGGVG